MTTTDGGPAFPVPGDQPLDGMSLRDWFAGQAMQSIILADGIQYANAETAHAEFAYRQADAMLIARATHTGAGE
jgi:hypothetical protein